MKKELAQSKQPQASQDTGADHSGDLQRGGRTTNGIYDDGIMASRTCPLSSLDYIGKARGVFLSPEPRYTWNEIIAGVDVRIQSGKTRRMFAVASNTFRGFHRVNKQLPGAGGAFRGYFLERRERLVKALQEIDERQALHELANRICDEIRSKLGNIKKHMLRPYNKIRKPVDLYLEHLVAMAHELDSRRKVLTPLLFLPLDSQVFGHPDLFTNDELAAHHLSRHSTFKDIATEASYCALQRVLQDRAKVIEIDGERVFYPIYFDLVWNNRYRKLGGNLFETNP